MKNKHILWHIGLPLTLLISILITLELKYTHNIAAEKQLLFLSLSFGSIPLIYQIIASFARRRFGIDIIAVTAIIGSLLLHQYLVGIIILLMLSTGETLEYFAFQRARKEIADLIAKAPTTARKKIGEKIISVDIDEIIPQDILVIGPGEIIPVDGIITKGHSFLDESALTGESMPVEKKVYGQVMSGSINQSDAIEIQATATSQNSKYEQIIRLVKEAESHEAPFVRMADRYSVRFTFITLGFALMAWFLSGDFMRVLAVLVVATPCPLILATPIAFSSGISRAAKRGIIVKNGGALETLAQARSFVFDKTGTLTLGTPNIRLIESASIPKEEILRIAASLDQISSHIIAQSLVTYANKQSVTLEYPQNFKEYLGKGVIGEIQGKVYILGKLSFLIEQGINIPEHIITKHESLKHIGSIVIYLADTKSILGDIHFIDTVRKETKALFQNLRDSGIERIIMLTGDKEKVAQYIAHQSGITEYRAECLPEDKIHELQKIQKTHAPVIMVGDGINDAPALVAADMGIALGARGSTASSEAGDIVITVNTIERIQEAREISRHVLAIAHQGILIGIGLSVTLMLLAAFGLVPPVLGAVLQEVIDVIAITNALRVHTTNFKYS